jgi:hypothetical protein
MSVELAEAFFRELYAPALANEELLDAAVITLWVPNKKSVHLPISDLAAVARTAIDLDATGQNVYFGVALRCPVLDSRHRGGKEDLAASTALWLDIDIRDEGTAHASKLLPINILEAKEILAAVGVAPSGVISSGYGLHAYWFLDEVQPLLDSTQIATFESANIALQERAKEYATKRGWHLDITANSDRVLRVPGTQNHKAAATRPVEIYQCSGERRPFKSYQPVGLAVSPAPATVQDPEVLTAFTIEIQKRRDRETSEARIARVKAKLTKLKKLEDRAMAKLVLEGKLFAAPGERDLKMTSIVGIITTMEVAFSPDEVLLILRPSLQAMQKEALEKDLSPATDEWVLDKISRSLETARAVQAATALQNESVLAGLMRAAHAVPSSNDGDGNDDGNDDGEPDGCYTPEQIQEFSDSQNCMVADFTKRWIIQRAQSFYVFCRGKYLSPIGEKELLVSLPRDLSLVPEGGPAAIKKQKFNMKSCVMVDKTVEEMLVDYATAARSAVVDLRIKHSYYNPESQTFFEAACPLRNIKAKYNPKIDQWLRVLGGEDAEQLLDWVATYTDLRRQTCAIYFSGPPSVGKNMFALGLARRWIANGSPTELKRILDNFNEDLTKCPLLFADEHIPTGQGSNKGAVTAVLRQLIGSDSRALSRKFMSNATLEGCLRLIIAGNNEHLLAAEEELSNDDLEAVGKRFLHIKTTQESVKYLRDLNGLSRTEGWVDGDGIAAHAVWLQENRVVVEGDRFLVEGHQTSFHQAMLTQGKTNGLVIDWLAKFLNAPEAMRDNIAQKGHIIVGDGEFLVNAQAIAESWDLFIKSDKTLSTSRIGKALRTLSTGEKRKHNARFHIVNLEIVYSWANANLVGNSETMEALVAHAITEKEMKKLGRSMLHVM